MSEDMMKTVKITLTEIDTGKLKVKKVKGYPLAMYIAAVLMDDEWQLMDRKTGAKIKDGFKTLGEARLYYHHNVRPKWLDIIKTQKYIDFYESVKKEVGVLV